MEKNNLINLNEVNNKKSKTTEGYTKIDTEYFGKYKSQLFSDNTFSYYTNEENKFPLGADKEGNKFIVISPFNTDIHLFYDLIFDNLVDARVDYTNGDINTNISMLLSPYTSYKKYIDKEYGDKIRQKTKEQLDGYKKGYIVNLPLFTMPLGIPNNFNLINIAIQKRLLSIKIFDSIEDIIKQFEDTEIYRNFINMPENPMINILKSNVESMFVKNILYKSDKEILF